MEKLLDLVGGKKLAWCVVLMILSTVAFFLGRVDVAGWWEHMQFLTVSFFGANVAMGAVHGFAKNKVSSDAKKDG